jgi:hypothetical protein
VRVHGESGYELPDEEDEAVGLLIALFGEELFDTMKVAFPP